MDYHNIVSHCTAGTMVPECWMPSIPVSDVIEREEWRSLPPSWAARPAVTIGAPVEKSEIGAIVQASQAVSSEIDPDKLIETLMRFAVEQTGAERGLLILLPGDAPQNRGRGDDERRQGRGGAATGARDAHRAA